MTRTVWQADMDRFSKALAPFVFTDGSGSWLSLDAPASLTEPYAKLTSAGYFNGWIA